MAAQEKYGKDYVATAATVRDTWFRQVPIIKKGIQNIKGQSGSELASRSRYGKIQDLMTAATSRQAFDAWWGNNNQFSDHRPQELDDLDDMANAATCILTYGLRKLQRDK